MADNEKIGISLKTFKKIQERYIMLKELQSKEIIPDKLNSINDELQFFSKVLANELFPYSEFYFIQFNEDTCKIILQKVTIVEQDFDNVFFTKENDINKLYINRSLIDNEKLFEASVNMFYFANKEKTDYYINKMKQSKINLIDEQIKVLNNKKDIINKG